MYFGSAHPIESRTKSRHVLTSPFVQHHLYRFTSFSMRDKSIVSLPIRVLSIRTANIGKFAWRSLPPRAHCQRTNYAASSQCSECRLSHKAKSNKDHILSARCSPIGGDKASHSENETNTNDKHFVIPFRFRSKRFCA